MSPRRCTSTWRTATPPGCRVRSISAAKRSARSPLDLVPPDDERRGRGEVDADGAGDPDLAQRGHLLAEARADAERAGGVGEEALAAEPREGAREGVHLAAPVAGGPHAAEARVEGLVELVPEVVVVGAEPGAAHADVRRRRGRGERDVRGGGDGDGGRGGGGGVDVEEEEQGEEGEREEERARGQGRRRALGLVVRGHSCCCGGGGG